MHNDGKNPAISFYCCGHANCTLWTACAQMFGNICLKIVHCALSIVHWYGGVPVSTGMLRLDKRAAALNRLPMSNYKLKNNDNYVACAAWLGLRNPPNVCGRWSREDHEPGWVMPFSGERECRKLWRYHEFMKLLNGIVCQFTLPWGNVNNWLRPEKVLRMRFRTRVRLPSPPPPIFVTFWL